MKRYMVFNFHRHYPLGGADDFVRDFENLEEASEFIRIECDAEYPDFDGEYWHILDTKTKTKTKKSYNKQYREWTEL